MEIDVGEIRPRKKSMANIIITGGLGFIGAHLVKQFIKSGHPTEAIHIVDTQRHFLPYKNRNQFEPMRIKQRFSLISAVHLYSTDTRHAFEMEDLIVEKRPKTIVHLAALPLANISNEVSQEASSTILTSTLNLLEILKRHSPETHFIYASSSMVYGSFNSPLVDENHPKEPINMYGAVKLAGEILVKAFCNKNRIPFSIVRPSAVYGPTDVNRRVVQAFFDDARLKKKITVNGRDSILDFTYVDDIASGLYLCCIDDKSKGEIFNITSGDPRSLGELAEYFMKRFGKIEVEYFGHEKDVPLRGGLDNSRIMSLLGYAPKFSLDRGLSRYIEEEMSWTNE